MPEGVVTLSKTRKLITESNVINHKKLRRNFRGLWGVRLRNAANICHQADLCCGANQLSSLSLIALQSTADQCLQEGEIIPFCIPKL